MGKVEETMEVLRKASKINNQPLPPNMDKIINQVSKNMYKTYLIPFMLTEIKNIIDNDKLLTTVKFVP